ncbi:class I SAM-dependent methyltransferase [Bradyrhizobium sp. Tv2a-2]|uniref:class I SAM-dependent methyltransferase n=1 Tax=Bradyrhizobium sp. Tv2a-2 TaxID=113395 RepID=UPI00041C4CE6|nr:class I SAM-dependent methyltransferase [Bradyrhizobium sp. Tv2a-2]
MPEQSNRVSSYFDQISDGYSARYEERNAFHSYFFRQRLKAATDRFVFDAKLVLDIGAGTGALYDELVRRSPTVDYFACDISPQMLAQSAIPAERAFVGRVSDISFPRDSFDFIYSLGVTTYQEPAELAANWRFIADHLAPKGTAVVSFTNRAAIDHAVRTVLRIAKPIIKRGVFGQSFATFAYRVAEVSEMTRAIGLEIEAVKFLNQTVSPFNTLLPMPSVAVAKAIDRHAPEALLPFLSADFVVFARRP